LNPLAERTCFSQALWQAWLRGQPPEVMAAIMKRRQTYAAALGAGKTPLLITAEAPDFAVAADVAAAVRGWGVGATSASVARAGCGALALALAEHFDVVHAFEPDEEVAAFLAHNLEATDRSWVRPHGGADGDYLAGALDDFETDVVVLSLLGDPDALADFQVG
jgi:hypothetical protein